MKKEKGVKTGRMTNEPERRYRHNISISKDSIEKAKEIGDGVISQGIRRALATASAGTTHQLDIIAQREEEIAELIDEIETMNDGIKSTMIDLIILIENLEIKKALETLKELAGE